MLAVRQPAGAVAQPEQRIELLHQLLRQPPPADRSDADTVPPAGSGDTSRIGNGMSSRQRMYTSRSSLRFSRVLPGGRSCLINRFSSTSAPSSERVAR
jgi:hypothetical protein